MNSPIEEVIIKKFKVASYRSDILFDFQEEAELMAEFARIHKATCAELKVLVKGLFDALESAQTSGVKEPDLEKHILSELSKVCAGFVEKHKTP